MAALTKGGQAVGAGRKLIQELIQTIGARQN